MIRKPKKRENHCGVCGAEMSSAASSSLHCECCGRVLCNSCVAHEKEGSIIYRVVWCKDCWEIGGRYRFEIEGLRDRIDGLYGVWKGACQAFNKKQG